MYRHFGLRLRAAEHKEFDRISRYPSARGAITMARVSDENDISMASKAEVRLELSVFSCWIGVEIDRTMLEHCT